MIDLYKGDCLEVMVDLLNRGIKVDVIITDPPYTISKKSGYVNNAEDKIDYIKKYGKHTIDFGSWDKISLDLESLFIKFYKLLNDGGTLLFFYDIWKFQEVKAIAEKIGFKQPRVCEWIKTNPVPINSKLNYLSNAKEYFCTFTKKAKPIFNSEYNKGIFEYPICGGKERTKHPTQKPMKLMEELVSIHTNNSSIVLDPFMGSGTTGVACKNLNRSFIGIELDDNYFEIAKERIHNEDISIK